MRLQKQSGGKNTKHSDADNGLCFLYQRKSVRHRSMDCENEEKTAKKKSYHPKSRMFFFFAKKMELEKVKKAQEKRQKNK